MDILIINKDDESNIKNIDIIDTYEVKDKKLRRFIYAPLCSKKDGLTQKFYIETNLMKVMQVNATSNYIFVKPNEIATSVFNKLDDHTLELLQVLCNEHVDFMNVSENSDDIDFIPIIEPDTGYIKIKFDKESEIKCKGNAITINDIAEGDLVKMLIFVECINVYPDENIAYDRLHIAFTDVTKEIVKHKREKLNNHVFYSSNSYYENVVLDDYDMSYIHTEKVNLQDDIESTPLTQLQTIPECNDESSNVGMQQNESQKAVSKRKITNERKPRKSKINVIS